MATKRGEKARLIELEERDQSGKRSRFSGTTSGSGHGHSPFKRPNEFIERLVLQTDTLQGLALLYNTSVAEIKKLNNLHTDTDLHARRVIKVPARGILIDLDDVPPPPPQSCLVSHPSIHHTQSILSSDEDNEENDLQVYLNGKDNLLKVIQEKANQAASVSPILNGSENPDISEVPNIRKGVYNATVDRKKESSLKWWHLFFPCLGFVFIFPLLIFIFQEHIHELDNSDNSTHSHGHY